MGMRTTAKIEKFQKEAGINPAHGERAQLLDSLSQKAYELIQVIVLESSGIRDGDGYWYGSDGFGGTAEDLIKQFREIEVFDRQQDDE